MTAWIAVLCIGAISLTFRIAPLAFAGRSTSPRASRFIKDGAAAVGHHRGPCSTAAQSGDVAALASPVSWASCSPGRRGDVAPSCAGSRHLWS
jgi:hypothetical protein